MNDKIHETAFSMPDGLRVYAIADIHGHLETLEKMHELVSMDLIDNPPEMVHMVYLGDYVDRGPNSRGVIENLMGRMARQDGIEKIFLHGNHESGMIAFLTDPEGMLAQDWLRYGGIQTLGSYGINIEDGVIVPSDMRQVAERLARAMPEGHHRFLGSLAGAIEIGEYFFAHAGVHPARALDDQDLDNLAFIREPFLSWNKPLAKMIVHGHSIAKEPVILPHRIGLDTGIYQKGGKLTTGVFEGKSVRFLQVETGQI